ncbi:MAG: 3-oxoacyl-[acyl-carrier-protein] reductase [Ruminococcaceae bacterium]|nr:3-oxoacyl-[acyl-carrier-protein] reductase [Oscillospiraceae bacterium]
MNLSGKTAIVTGGARGIGAEIAHTLAEFGANVVLCDIPGSAAEQTASDIQAAGGKAVAVFGDVRNASDAEMVVKTATETFGSIDILVNNAGITRDGLMLRMSEQDWDDVMDINLKGAFLMTKAVTRPMMKQRSGAIINITSVVGVMGNAGQANYSASKAGLIGLTKTTAKELASRGIRCNAVAPGFIESAMTDKLPEEVKQTYFASIPLKKFGSAKNIAHSVAFLASEYANYITGQILHIDGGLLM